jgi:hypothetical protein
VQQSVGSDAQGFLVWLGETPKQVGVASFDAQDGSRYLSGWQVVNSVLSTELSHSNKDTLLVTTLTRAASK